MPLRWLLSFAPIRRRIIFEIAQKYFSDLPLTIPLPGKISCPIVSLEHLVSYENVFCEHEYDGLLKEVPLPRRWLDLGCHAGHFSLLLASRWAETQGNAGWQALLVDADSRSALAVREIQNHNSFARDQFQFLPGAIAESGEDLMFAERDYMTSELVRSSADGGRVRRVTTVPEKEILKRLAPPYDLIKLDVEGAEYDFFEHYQELVSQTRFLIFEAHSWHRGGGGRDQLISMAERLDFQLRTSCHEERVTRRDQAVESCSLVLMERRV